MSKLWVVTIVICCLVLPAHGQTVSGTITGTVIDQSSLPVAGALVRLLNQDTGVMLSQNTGSSGDFVFTAIQRGEYTVTAEMAGFKRVEKKNLNITAAERLSAGELKLTIGDVTDSVTVDASGTPVQTNSEERSGL